MLLALNTSLSRRDTFDVCVGWRHAASLAPGEFALFALAGDFLVRPEGSGLRIKGIEADGDSCVVALSGRGYHRLHVALAPECALESFSLDRGAGSWRPMGWNCGVLGLRLDGESALRLSAVRRGAAWAPTAEAIPPEFQP